jgi:hypothetical protein
MGREDMEDYNSDFLTMLETWEAAAGRLWPSREGQEAQYLEIAKLLGWVQADSRFSPADHPEGNSRPKRSPMTGAVCAV